MEYAVYLLYDDAPAEEAQPAPRALVEAALAHTRDWPAAKTAAQAKQALKLVEELPAVERLTAFCERVLATAKQHPPRAILWAPAERLVSRELLEQALADDDVARIAVNVRLYHVEDAPGETVLDTMGLQPLGLPDVQCHFVTLDRAAVAALVTDVARYVLDEGEVIGEGDTVPGPNDTSWVCHVEESLLDPPREVIDLEPPPPYAARRRL